MKHQLECVCMCKTEVHEQSLHGIVREWVWPEGSHIQTQQQSGRQHTERGVEGFMLLWEELWWGRGSWNKMSRFHQIFQTQRSEIKSSGKSFVIDEDTQKEVGVMHTNTPAILGVLTAAELSDTSPLWTVSSCLQKLRSQVLYIWEQQQQKKKKDIRARRVEKFHWHSDCLLLETMDPKVRGGWSAEKPKSVCSCWRCPWQWLLQMISWTESVTWRGERVFELCNTL